MKIYASSDHAGLTLRRRLVEHLRAQGHDVDDRGPATADPIDYPDEAAHIGRLVRADPGARGILVCGSGVGVCMAANKIRGIRAAHVTSMETARLSRSHNDANVLCLGERLTVEADALSVAAPWVAAWLETPFEGGRHAPRVAKMAALEVEECENRGQQPGEQPRAAEQT